MPKSTTRFSGLPSRTGLTRPSPRAARPRAATVIVISFTGTIDGEPFEGGAGDDVPVLIGSGGFIPGFEEQLIGIAAGRNPDRQGHRSRKNYSRKSLPERPHLRGDRQVRSRCRAEVTVDDAFAGSLGARIARQAQGGDQRRIAQRARGGKQPEAQARVARPARRNCTSSKRRRRWSRRSSTTYGRPCCRTSEVAEPHLRGRGDDRGEGHARSIATSPTGGSGSDWCLPKSARRTTSRSQRRSVGAAARAEPPISPARKSRCGNTTARTRRHSPIEARRSTRKRWSTFSSSWPSVTEYGTKEGLRDEELFKADDDDAEDRAVRRRIDTRAFDARI